jgi:hypothetical protein
MILKIYEIYTYVFIYLLSTKYIFFYIRSIYTGVDIYRLTTHDYIILI